MHTDSPKGGLQSKRTRLPPPSVTIADGETEIDIEAWARSYVAAVIALEGLSPLPFRSDHSHEENERVATRVA
jgi:hypothetical protein